MDADESDNGFDALRAFLEHLPAVAWVKDEDGRYVYVSPQYLDRFGVTQERAWGKTDLDLWPADVARQFRAGDLLILQSGRPLVTIERGDAGSRWWAVKFPFASAGGRRYVGGMAVDITTAAGDVVDRTADTGSRVTMCAWTRKFRVGEQWVTVEQFLRERLGVTVTHGISDEALAKVEVELRAEQRDGGGGPG